ncbi:MAG: hypothetical protein AB7H93_23635 [Vicinamibacterales bacterium]
MTAPASDTPAVTWAVVVRPYDPGESVTLEGPPLPGGFGAGGMDAAEWSYSGAEVPVYLCGVGPAIRTGPADNPPDTLFRPVLRQPCRFEARLFEGSEPGESFRLSRTFSAIEVVNADGWLDERFADGWDGRAVELWSVPRAAATGRADWPNATRVFAGEVERVDWREGRAIVALRDRRTRFAAPLARRHYTGEGGTAGDAHLAGRPVPLCYGEPGGVIEPEQVDAANRVWQWHDGPSQALDGAFDKGAALTVGSDYPDYAALVAASVSAGTVATCLAESLVRVGDNLAGRLTLKVRGDAAGDGYTDTAAGIVRRVVTSRLGATGNLADPGDLDTAAFTALASAQAANLGVYVGADEVTAAAFLDGLLGGVGAWWGLTLAGLFTCAVFAAPSGGAAATLRRRDFRLGDDALAARPGAIWRTRVGHGRNFAVQAPSETVEPPAITAEARAALAQEYRWAVAEDGTVRTKHRLARIVDVPAPFADAADALAEAVRRQALFGAPPLLLTVPVTGRAPFAVDLGAVVHIEDLGRFGLAATTAWRLVGLDADLARGTLTWTLWGGNAA